MNKPLDYIHICLSAHLAHCDLVAADAALEAGPNNQSIRLILIKQLLLTCSNVADLESSCRRLYKEHSELSEIIKPFKNKLEFTKYVRNIFVGHINSELCRKTMEWQPILYALLAEPKAITSPVVGYLTLETALNTYVNDKGHRIFESDTDLNYPPDRERFHNFLGSTVHACIRYTKAVAQIAAELAELEDFEENWLNLAIKAGATDFLYLKKPNNR